jgi:uncharacterized lipoprotein YehR (DUF1307 family)
MVPKNLTSKIAVFKMVPNNLTTAKIIVLNCDLCTILRSWKLLLPIYSEEKKASFVSIFSGTQVPICYFVKIDKVIRKNSTKKLELNANSNSE